MSLLLFLIIGGVVGWAASAIAGRDEGLFASIAIGVVGAFIGGFISTLFGAGSQTYTSLTWSGIIWSLIGAVILAAVLNMIQGHSYHRN